PLPRGRIKEGVKEENLVKMLLQVHDELVFEVKNELVNKVARIIKQEMESAYTLRVPIKVDLESGQNWGELKSLVI
ncbi:hypothetical protein HQ544_04615, partial [Candidatus Falkowbacteria bacterium]|nr:hypothetical protein [Candidatus Falkowbacteria bacterium]